MKKIAFLLLAVVMVVVSSCDLNKVTYLSGTVNLDLTEVPSDAPTPSSFTVTFTNFDSNYEVVVESANNVATTDSLIAGIYTISVSQTVSSDGFSYLFSGTLTNVSITETGLSYTLPIKVAEESALVLKEIFYCGSEGYYFRDQFYEIYNQSDEIVYADGLCIAGVMSETTYTWDIKDEDNYIFAQLIWQVPGTGNQYPINPGESIIISQYATDHNAEDKNPGNSLNLSTAEFETYVEQYANKQVDGPSPNMLAVCNAAGYWAYQYLNSVMGFGFVVFYPTTPIVDDNYITSLTPSTSTNAREILRKDVVDAVEMIGDETKMESKALPSDLDAGGIWTSGTFKGESIMRKISKQKEDGTNVYQDTNNTTNDFEISTTPTIRRNGAKRPSWSTWGN